MKKYDVTLTAHYQKTVSVYAESPEQAKEKTKITTIQIHPRKHGIPCRDKSGGQDKNNFIIVIDYTNCKKNFCETHKNIGKKAEK